MLLQSYTINTNQSIKSLSSSIHPSMNWQSHASSVKLGSWTGNRKKDRQKDDGRNGKSKTLLYIKLLLHVKLESCFLGAGFASFFFSSVGAAFFFGASLLGSFSCNIGGTDMQILLVRGIWETRNGSSYCSFMFTFVWVDNGQPENWHNTSKAPTCHQKNKSFKKCRSFFGSFASLVSFVSFTSFTSFVSLASFTSFTSSAGSALRMAWAVCYDMPATSSNPSWSGGFPEKWRKKQHPSWEYGEAIHQGNCTWRSSMQLPCIGFY